jgi:hypothetical protein
MTAAGTGSPRYTTELSKGQGAVPEMLALLRFWEPGMSTDTLAARVLEQGILGKASARRTQDLVKVVFARRYLVDNAQPAKSLKHLLQASARPAVLRQLMFLFTCRDHAILRDFVIRVYWPKYAAAASTVGRKEGLELIERGIAHGNIPARWSDKMSERVAGYLVGTLADFGLLEEGRASDKKILPFRIELATTLYLAHEIHFAGIGDTSILDHLDWALFGLSRADVVQEIERGAFHGHYIFQYSGEFARISWRYRTMEEALDAIARQPL